MSLAPYFYRNILWKYGGPIRKIDCVKLQNGYEAYAFLLPDLIPSCDNENELFDSIDGAGFGQYKNKAVYKAVSEALERWAFYSLVRSSKKSLFGFDVDSSTTGMAAFPGLIAKSARKMALNEAAERWSIVQWWLGHLKIEDQFSFENSNFIEIATPFLKNKLLIAWRYNEESSRFYYGVASNSSMSDAKEQSLVELDRNQLAIDKFISYNTAYSPEDLISDMKNASEKRLLYFSIGEGKDIFFDRIKSTVKNSVSLPALIIDKRVNGPWEKYSHVWRCLFDPGLDLKEYKKDYKNLYV